MKEGVCGHHDNMLEKQEFRWVFGICFTVFGGVIFWVMTNYATVSDVRATEDKLKYMDASDKSRADRLERSLEKLNGKLDKIDEYLRGATTGSRYR